MSACIVSKVSPGLRLARAGRADLTQAAVGFTVESVCQGIAGIPISAMGLDLGEFL